MYCFASRVDHQHLYRPVSIAPVAVLWGLVQPEADDLRFVQAYDEVVEWEALEALVGVERPELSISSLPIFIVQVWIV